MSEQVVKVDRHSLERAIKRLGAARDIKVVMRHRDMRLHWFGHGEEVDYISGSLSDQYTFEHADFAALSIIPGGNTLDQQSVEFTIWTNDYGTHLSYHLEVPFEFRAAGPEIIR